MKLRVTKRRPGRRSAIDVGNEQYHLLTILFLFFFIFSNSLTVELLRNLVLIVPRIEFL